MRYADDIFALGREFTSAMKDRPTGRPLRLSVGIADVVPKLIAYLSQVVTLEPGDLIFTGTPPGVGVARKPPVFLKAGDDVEVEIERVGLLRNPVVAG